MFRIKICGITRAADAEAAADAGADCIGLNFYRGSPRFLEAKEAQKVLDAVRGNVLAAGVFVNAQPEAIAHIAGELKLDLVQLSGNEPPEFVRELKGLMRGVPIMQAARAGSQGLSAVEEHLEACRRMHCLPELILWDAYDAAQFGGTGRVADWQLAAACIAGGEFPPLVLAGGLRPENVAAAISAVRPHGVDTASGVESRPGVKDAEKLRSFVRAARSAFDNEPPAD